MAYNYFPQNYQMPAYYPQVQQPQMPGTQMSLANQPQQQASSLIWVQGEGAAKSYLVAPGCTVALFDNESQTIYIKSADASGMPSMRILDYTFRDSAPQGKAVLAESDFAKQSDVDYLKS
jgi:hypothetical protein